jgi:Predicted nucleic acid-binding protein, contains PIN domain
VKEPAVADSTCLIVLERIRRLELLRGLFEPLVIPPSVQEEFGRAVDWLIVQAPSDLRLIRVLRLVVDDGEAEAIALALEKGWQRIVDDRKARSWAKRLGIRIIGTAGVLIRAKQAGLIPSVKPLLEAMQQEGFRMDPVLMAEVLRLAGE